MSKTILEFLCVKMVAIKLTEVDVAIVTKNGDIEEEIELLIILPIHGPRMNSFPLSIVFVCVCVCVCIKQREIWDSNLN